MTQIKTNILLPGDKLPTEQQLMNQYRVSRITVSKALTELKSEGLIIRFPNKGTFVAEAIPPSSLVSKIPTPLTPENPLPSMTEIACIIPSITDLFSLSIINGVHSVFPTDRYICHIFQSPNPTVENYLLQRCLDINISGIVLFPQDQPFFSNPLLWMQVQKYPLVLLDRYLPRLDTSYVIADNHAAGALCLRHLYDLGHRKIAFITSTGVDTFSIKSRIEGVKEEASALNLPPYAIEIIDYFDRNKSFNYHHTYFLKLIAQDHVTAFITAESTTCAYLYDLLTSMDVNIPEHVSIVSFDKPVSSCKHPDFFTHINQSEHLMGRKAGMLLKNRIEQEDMNVYHQIITPTLEVHESSARVNTY